MIRKIGFHMLTAVLGLVGVSLAGADVARAVDLTFDVTDYSYSETDDNGNFQMTDDSKWPFLSLGVRDWDRPAEDGKFGLIYNGEATYGHTHYHGRSAGTMMKRYYKGRLEGNLTCRLNDMITPFAGLGYRIVHDDSGGHFPSNGGVSYDRQNHLVYVPFGFLINPVENLTFKAQANAVLLGRQISFTSDGDTGYPDGHNQQDKGWGVDFAADYRMTEKWSVYGFYRYWSIDRSDSDCGDVAGQGYVCWWEPDNTTTEIGVGVAYKF